MHWTLPLNPSWMYIFFVLITSFSPVHLVPITFSLSLQYPMCPSSHSVRFTLSEPLLSLNLTNLWLRNLPSEPYSVYLYPLITPASRHLSRAVRTENRSFSRVVLWLGPSWCTQYAAPILREQPGNSSNLEGGVGALRGEA